MGLLTIMGGSLLTTQSVPMLILLSTNIHKSMPHITQVALGSQNKKTLAVVTYLISNLVHQNRSFQHGDPLCKNNKIKIT